MRHLLCLIAICAGTGPALAQGPIFTGESRDYVILRQPQRDHAIELLMRPVNPATGAEPQAVEWERWSPNGPAYTEARRIEWFAAASCASGIESLRIEGPSGTQNQTLGGTRNTISGSINYDSFDPDALDAICQDVAQQATATCGEIPIGEPGCDTVFTRAFGPSMPLPGSAQIRVSGQCSNGPIPATTYVPRLRLTCRLTESE
ncbi:hypothetical protein [Jannaschia pohangensis]|uniref:Secreted protein n=1 Tax=Jannaschia pohangensis TaxID=390807 RepID=A0A1I3NQY8_9RHOB|nr:hypothetical protein [Jannaschia pohangensis]SFJ11701.1 hypothetical protein SAMN04488095_2228 [Jannaschia pohangensis]